MTPKQRIYESLREDILLGSLAPGERLTEDRLAARFRVSRTPIREVLGRLEADQLVVLERFRGATVRPLGTDEIQAMFDLRALLEGYAARRAASRMPAHFLDEMTALNEELAHLGREFPRTEGEGEPSQEIVRRAVEANRLLHMAVVGAGENPYLESILATVFPVIYRSIRRYTVEDMMHSVYQHCEVIRAIRRRDAQWAETAMQTHIFRGRDNLLRQLIWLVGEEQPGLPDGAGGGPAGARQPPS